MKRQDLEEKNEAETGRRSLRRARMATLRLTMASRKPKQDTVETWQRVNHAREFIVGQQVFLNFLMRKIETRYTSPE